MKRKLVWLVIAAVLATALMIMVSSGKPGLRPQIEFSFLSFSNSPTGPLAAFAVYFPPRFGGCGWSEVQLDSLKAGVWTNNNGLSNQMQFFVGNYPRARASNGRSIGHIAVLPVPNTNDAWRFRIKVDEMPQRAPFFVQVCHDLFLRWGRNQGQNSYRTYDYSYWLTNEVRPSEPPTP